MDKYKHESEAMNYEASINHSHESKGHTHGKIKWSDKDLKKKKPSFLKQTHYHTNIKHISKNISSSLEMKKAATIVKAG